MSALSPYKESLRPKPTAPDAPATPEVEPYTLNVLANIKNMERSVLPPPDVDQSARELEYAEAAVLESDDQIRRLVGTVDGARNADAHLKPADVEKLVRTALELNAHLRDRADKLRTAHHKALIAAQKK